MTNRRARPRARLRGRRVFGPAAVVAAASALVIYGLLPRSAGGARAADQAPASQPAAPAASDPPAGTPSASPSASPAASASASGGPAAPGPWHVAFSDDFSGSTLNPSHWVTCYDWNVDGCTNAGNHELEWYLPGQVSVGGGMAQLTANKTPTRGSDGTTYAWTSGMISTGRSSWNASPRFTFTYGYVSARIKLPSALGMFPAFWLLPASRKAPPELDVAEGLWYPTRVLMNIHWAGAGGKDLDASKEDALNVDYSAAFHTYALDWEPDRVTWYLDGVEQYVVTDRAIIPTVPMELLINLAVGFPNPPPADVSQAGLQIDDVTVWQH